MSLSVKSPCICKLFPIGSIFLRSIEINFPFFITFEEYWDQLPGAAPISTTDSPPLNILNFSSISINL